MKILTFKAKFNYFSRLKPCPPLILSNSKINKYQKYFDLISIKI